MARSFLWNWTVVETYPQAPGQSLARPPKASSPRGSSGSSETPTHPPLLLRYCFSVTAKQLVAEQCRGVPKDFSVQPATPALQGSGAPLEGDLTGWLPGSRMVPDQEGLTGFGDGWLLTLHRIPSSRTHGLRWGGTDALRTGALWGRSLSGELVVPASAGTPGPTGGVCQDALKDLSPSSLGRLILQGRCS